MLNETIASETTDIDNIRTTTSATKADSTSGTSESVKTTVTTTITDVKKTDIQNKTEESDTVAEHNLISETEKDEPIEETQDTPEEEIMVYDEDLPEIIISDNDSGNNTHDEPETESGDDEQINEEVIELPFVPARKK